MSPHRREREIPTLFEVRRARRRIAPYLIQTPLLEHPSLSRAVGTTVLVKHENHLPTGAFKVRGGINLMAQLTDEESAAGVIAASTGNHGQSVAYAAELFGVKARICVPEQANATKVQSMKDLGAEIIVHGRDYDDAREHCEKLAEENGYRYIHSGNESQLVAGVATATLEILESRPDVDVIIVPIGGGSGASGACIAAKSLRAKASETVEVIGVQSEAAPAAYLSWKSQKLVEDKIATYAEGLQTRTAFELPQRILWALLDDFILVSDDDIRSAQVQMIQATRNLVEAAGAAPLAAALKLKEKLAGKTVTLMSTGANVTLDQLKSLLDGADQPT
jgi:threonine dehydratase